MNQYKSPYRRGADDGAWFGLYLTALFYSSAFSQHFPLLSLVTLALVVMVPVVVYIVLRRTYVAESYTSQLSSLWMQGIMMFFCGSLIAGLFSLVYMKWVNPTYIIDTVRASIDVYRQLDNPTLQEAADGLQMMLDAGAVPSAVSLVFATLWSAVLSGSILSLLASLIVRAVNSPRTRSRFKQGVEE